MAKNEEVLEELYELLDLYFRISPAGSFVKSFVGSGGCKDVEPALDRVIFKEKILARITSLIIENYIL